MLVQVMGGHFSARQILLKLPCMTLYILPLLLPLTNYKFRLVLMSWGPSTHLILLIPILLSLMIAVLPPVFRPVMMHLPLSLLSNIRTREQGGSIHLLQRIHQQGGESGGSMPALICHYTQNYLKFPNPLSTLTSVLL